jgi:hypothetical protein
MLVVRRQVRLRKPNGLSVKQHLAVAGNKDLFIDVRIFVLRTSRLTQLELNLDLERLSRPHYCASRCKK